MQQVSAPTASAEHERGNELVGVLAHTERVTDPGTCEGEGTWLAPAWRLRPSR